jgi:hypothetical protein
MKFEPMKPKPPVTSVALKEDTSGFQVRRALHFNHVCRLA